MAKNKSKSKKKPKKPRTTEKQKDLLYAISNDYMVSGEGKSNLISAQRASSRSFETDHGYIRSLEALEKKGMIKIKRKKKDKKQLNPGVTITKKGKDQLPEYW